MTNTDATADNLPRTPDGAIDLLALLAEVEAPDYVPSPEIAAAMAAYDAETARIAKVLALANRTRTGGTCGRCRGTGHLPQFRHVSGGDCFACSGTGDA